MMLNSRRDILKLVGMAMILPPSFDLFAFGNDNPEYSKIVRKARKNKWMILPLNLLMTNIAMEFIDVPYVGGTLDQGDNEVCSVFLDKLDCVTYFETVLGIAFCFRANKFEFKDLISQVKSTRYRNGEITDYTSRLHYTADWIYNNTKNGVVKDITPKIGGEKIHFNVGFMSNNPDKYNQLKLHPEFVPVIKQQEDEINDRDYYYLPKEKIGNQIKGVESCDIVALTTSIKGLDYSHIGFAFKNEIGDIQFLHASSAKKKVTHDTTLAKYIQAKTKDTGITVLRPLEK